MNFEYYAVTNSTLENCAHLLKVYSDGMIEEYYPRSDKWKDPNPNMWGIYCGSPESETVTEQEAEYIIEVLKKRVNKSV